jgi:hypothetical protein
LSCVQFLAVARFGCCRHNIPFISIVISKEAGCILSILRTGNQLGPQWLKAIPIPIVNTGNN